MYDPFSCTASTTCPARVSAQCPVPSAQCPNSPTARVRGAETAHLLPRGDLRAVPDAGRVREPARLRRDEDALGDEQRAADAGALRVVLDDEARRGVRGVVAVARHGREDDAVREGGVADLDGLEEGGGGRHRDRNLAVQRLDGEEGV